MLWVGYRFVVNKIIVIQSSVDVLGLYFGMHL